ncbi:MAG: hypothetical protein Q7R75_00410 [bacterium]|nr:hypothetical protein [bacterium]
MRREILIKVWQKAISPALAIRELEVKTKHASRVLELLVALKDREITVNEAEEEMVEEEVECGELHC